jgi:hypothetical protein
MLSAPQNRDVLEPFLEWLLTDEPPIHHANGQITERLAEFRPEDGQDRKRRLRALRRKRKNRTLSGEEQQTLESYERSSAYSNKYASVTHQKEPRKKGQGNLEEWKRLFVAEKVARNLYPNTKPYEYLHERFEGHLHPDTRAIEVGIRRFEQEWIASGRLTCQQVVEEQYERFKSFSVLRDMSTLPDATTSEKLNPFFVAKFYPHLLTAASPEQPARRMAWTQAQGARMAFRASERVLLAPLCKLSKSGDAER